MCACGVGNKSHIVEMAIISLSPAIVEVFEESQSYSYFHKVASLIIPATAMASLLFSRPARRLACNNLLSSGYISG